ncbi:MAG: prmA [Candidatus Binatus sp.]|nr:prmA [Candidatus Binatus sp.]
MYAFAENRRKPVPPGSQQARAGSRMKAPGMSKSIWAKASVIRKKSYTKAVFHTPANLADEAAGILVAGGAIGCAIAGMTAPRARAKNVVVLEAWFNAISDPALARLRRIMADAGMLVEDAHDGKARRIVDPGWATLWMKRFGPFRVGRRFLIVPPWKRETQAGRHTIVIQPAQAFGTGHHPTTAGVLREIEVSARAIIPASMLDVGTGTGLLAIAAAMLGAREIIATDVDPIALDNARDNARLNNLERRIRFSPVPLNSIRRRFDLVTVNILSETLIELAPRLKRMVAPHGRLILGGLLADEADDVMRHYRPELRLLRKKTHRGWTSMVLASAASS